MALRLKSRMNSPPNGFLYHQKETNWQSWKVAPITQYDFKQLCLALQAHRRANPQYHLATDLAVIEAEVDQANAVRVAAMPNTESYLMNTEAPVPFLQAPKAKPLNAAEKVSALAAGAETVDDFLESGEQPVNVEVATERAQICAECPQNGRGDMTRWFTIPASELIRKQLERREQRGLTTMLDGQLGICTACLCPLKLKVHFQLPFILKHMSDDVKKKLDPRCWITK